MTFHEIVNGMTVMDGRARIARARPCGPAMSGFWVLKLYGGCWVDPRARQPSAVTGSANPQFMVVYGRASARRELEALAMTGSS